MIKAFALVAVVLAALSFSNATDAQIFLHRAPQTSIGGGGSCPMGDGLGDGCPAPSGGTFTISNCFPSDPTAFSVFRKANQTWYTSRPGSWNWPACDYPIGAETPDSVMLASAIYDPMQASANGNPLPAGCTPHATGYPGNPTMGYIDCSKVANGVQVSLKHLYMGAWTGPGTPHAAMAIYCLRCGADATYTLEDLKFVGDADNTAVSHYGSMIQMDDAGHGLNVYLKSVTVNGRFSDPSGCCNQGGYQDFVIRVTGAISFDYVAMDDVGGYDIDAGRGNSATNTLSITHSWIRNCVQRAPMGHAECTHGALWNSVTFDYNIWTLDPVQIGKQSMNHLGSGGTQSSGPLGPLTITHQLAVLNFGQPNIPNVTYQVINGVVTLQSNLSAPLTPGYHLPGNQFWVSALLSGDGKTAGSTFSADCAAQQRATPQCGPHPGTSSGGYGLPGVDYGPVSGTAKAPYSNFSLADWGSDQFTTVTIMDNFFDPVGVTQGGSARGYMGSPRACGSPATFARNVNLETGAGNNTTAGSGGNKWSYIAFGSGC